MQVVAISSARTISDKLLLDAHHKLRARVFSERLGWDVAVVDGREADRFDELNPTYVMAIASDARIAGCARLLPAVGPTMASEVFPSLLPDRRLSAHSGMIESSRFCVDTTLEEGRGSALVHEATLTELENQVSTAAKGWESTIMNAAKSLFWILAAIEIGIAAVWLGIQAASLDSWFAELVRRIMFIGIFAFALDQGPTVAKGIVDSLFQIGAGGGSASPAAIFDASIEVASKMSGQVQFGLFEDNALAIAAVFAMVVVGAIVKNREIIETVD